jgi:hypothetical protein
VPPDVPDATATWPDPDWKPLLEATRVDPTTLVAAAPLWPPPEATDVRRAWTSGDLRIEAAAFRGRIVWYSVVPPWRAAREATPAPRAAADRVRGLLQGSLVVIGIVAGVFFARRNLALGRSDRRGASRFAAVFFTLGFVAQLLTFTNVMGSFPHAMATLGLQLFSGALVWIAYVALEPYVRRLWPDTLTAWGRVLDGRFRDPLVGRHILMGAVAGIVFTAIFLLPQVAAPLFGIPPAAPHGVSVVALGGVRLLLSQFLLIGQSSFFIPVVVLLLMLVLRVVLRRTLLVYAVFLVISVLLAPNRTIADVATTVAAATLLVGILTRLGVLALVVAIFFSTWEHVPLTTDPNSWFFPWSVMTMALFAAVAVYGFVVSLGGKLRFTAAVLDE